MLARRPCLAAAGALLCGLLALGATGAAAPGAGLPSSTRLAPGPKGSDAGAPGAGLLGAPEGPRARVVTELPWTESRVARVPGATLAPRGPGQPFDALRIVHGGPGAKRFQLLALPSPRLRHRRYALMGRLRTEAVEGDAHLEMWSHFPEKGRFFSRSLAPDGPLRTLTGTQAWRRFALPYDAAKSLKPPTLIELGLVLPGRGTVLIGPVRLIEIETPPPGAAAPPMRPRKDGPPPSVPPWRRGQLWWAPEHDGWVLAVGASALAALAVALVLFGLWPRRLRLVRQLVLVAGLAGAVALVLGVVALSQDQPPEVHRPLFWLGGGAWILALAGAALARRVATRAPPRGG